MALNLDEIVNKLRFVLELSDAERPELPASGSPRSDCQALNYSALASAAGAVTPSSTDANLNSTETLLRNIQGLLKVAADNARQQERQINYEKGKSLFFLFFLLVFKNFRLHCAWFF